MNKTIVADIDSNGDIINLEIAEINKLSQCQNDDCKFVIRSSSKTSMNWSYLYDKLGHRSGSDPNTCTNTYLCLTCRRWFETTTRCNKIVTVKELQE